MYTESNHYMICVANHCYEASLEPRKLQQVLTDKEADKNDQVRVIDESGEDYLALQKSSRRATVFRSSRSARAMAAKVREMLGREAAATPAVRSVLMIDDGERYRELMRRKHQATVRAGELFAVFDQLRADPLEKPGVAG